MARIERQFVELLQHDLLALFKDSRDAFALLAACGFAEAFEDPLEPWSSSF